MMRVRLALASWRMRQPVGIRFRCNSTIRNWINLMGKFDNELEMVEYA
jgi:hypothetical protein